MAESSIDTLDSGALRVFFEDLQAHGFKRLSEDDRAWSGPIAPALQSFTSATTMQITICDGWPYLPPHLEVEGIESWHANLNRLCLWQEGDNTKAWINLEGILARIDQWVAQARNGFIEASGAALDPHLYYRPLSGEAIEIDIEQMVSGAYQDGQRAFFHLSQTGPTIRLVSGCPLPGQDSQPREGRWFYRSEVKAPPANLSQFEAALTENQKNLYNKDLARLSQGLFTLIWPTPHGNAALILHVKQNSGARVGTAFQSIPASTSDRLRRAGPDADTLQNKRVILLGVGAIGSHLASILVRSGLGRLTLVDADFLYRPGQVRHAAEAEAVGDNKAALMKRSLRHLDWTNIEIKTASPRTPRELTAMISGFDLCIDATGLAPITELLSRITARDSVPLVSVALYRGGSIARVRRQAEGDTLILNRRNYWRYPTIPAGDSAQDFVGVEVGCAAPIHNAPPASVMYAAAIGALTAIDLLMNRRAMPDELIDVLDPREPPFEHRGRLTIGPPTVLLTDDARAAMITAAVAAHPNETGGVLVGVHDDTGTPVIVRAVELLPDQPSPAKYILPPGTTAIAVDNARAADSRLGYIGEWHSHPTDQSASPTDRVTMRSLANHADTGNPVLLVLRPKRDGIYDVDAFVATGDGLQQTEVIAVGPLAESDEQQQ